MEGGGGAQGERRESIRSAIHEHAENISKKQQKDVRRKENREKGATKKKKKKRKSRNGILIPSNGDPLQISIFLLSYRTFVTVMVMLMLLVVAVMVVVVVMVEVVLLMATLAGRVERIGGKG